MQVWTCTWRYIFRQDHSPNYSSSKQAKEVKCGGRKQDVVVGLKRKGRIGGGGIEEEGRRDRQWNDYRLGVLHGAWFYGCIAKSPNIPLLYRELCNPVMIMVGWLIPIELNYRVIIKVSSNCIRVLPLPSSLGEGYFQIFLNTPEFTFMEYFQGNLIMFSTCVRLL